MGGALSGGLFSPSTRATASGTAVLKSKQSQGAKGGSGDGQGDGQFRVDWCGMQNGFRSNQDRVAVSRAGLPPSMLLCLVLDGHGEEGADVAQSCATYLPKRIAAGISSGVAKARAEAAGAGADDADPNPADALDAVTRAVRSAVEAAVQEMHRGYLDGYERDVLPQVRALKEEMEASSGVQLPDLRPAGSGATVVAAVVEAARGYRRVHVSWVGDAEAAVVRVDATGLGRESSAIDGRPAVPTAAEVWAAGVSGVSVSGALLTAAHTLSRDSERARVEKAGGQVCGSHIAASGVEGMLMVSRAVGDPGLARAGVVTCDAEHRAYAVSEHDLLLVLASDGVWGVVSPTAVGRMLVDGLAQAGYRPGAHAALAAVTARVSESVREKCVEQHHVDDCGIVVVVL